LNLRLVVLFAASCAAVLAQTGGDFGGPSVLSRGGGAQAAQGGPTGFRFYGGVDGVYDGGLVPASVDPNGNLLNIDHLLGVEANVGVYGRKSWTNSGLVLSYNGSYRDYTANQYYNGSDHVLSLDGQVRLSRHVTLISRNGAGTVSRSIGGIYGFVNTPDALLGIPSNEIFDNRSYFLQSSDQIIYQKSTRLSFSVAGQGFFVRRQSKALVGVDGYGAQGTMAYRLSRRDTVDLAYAYLHFDYPRAFGDSDIHQLTVGYSRALSRRWQFSSMVGAYRVETVGITTVALDPATAALFGFATTVEAFHKVNYLPAISADVTGQFKKASISVSYSRAPNPGNGVFLTSQNENANINYTYNGISRWNFSVNGGYSRLASIGQEQLGAYSYKNAGASAMYRLGHDVNIGLRVLARNAQIEQNNGFKRLGTSVSLSIEYSPGERPLNFWR
jgi:hypothetical protein